MYTVKTNNKDFQIKLHANSTDSGIIDNVDFDLDIQNLKNGKYHLLKEGKSYQIEVLESNTKEKYFKLKINGEVFETQINSEFDNLLKKLGMDAGSSKKINELKAPMPGLVLTIEVSEGQEVLKGDNLLILEAMKMENIIKSPTDGVVKLIKCKINEAVEKNQVLIVFE